MSAIWLEGSFEDGWIGISSRLLLKNVQRASLKVYLPVDDEKNDEKTLKVFVDQADVVEIIIKRGEETDITFTPPETIDGETIVNFITVAEQTSSSDERELGYFLTELKYEERETKLTAGLMPDTEESTFKGIKYFVFPNYNATNPYQAMIEASLPKTYNVEYSSLDKAVNYLMEQKTAKLNHKVIFHLHWTSHILSESKNEAQARGSVNLFLRQIDSFLKLGGEFIWTIHNIVPHDAEFIDEEIRLREQISIRASIVHVHSKGSVDEIEAQFKLRTDNLSVIPHPSYRGVYGNYVSRASARAVLGIQEDEFCFLFLGQIRPYKGLDRLLAAAREMWASGKKFKLIIAGKPVYPFSSQIVKSMLADFVDIVFKDEFIRDDELQLYYSASDVAIFPYRNILTSGSVLSALSFDTPVIAPAYAAIRDVVKTGKTGWAYPVDTDSLVEVMTTALNSREKLPAMSENCRTATEKLTWKKFSRSLSTGINKVFKNKTYQISLDLEGVDVTYALTSNAPASEDSVAIIIVSYQNISDIRRLLETIATSSDTNFTVFIIDNCSANLQDTEFANTISEFEFEVVLYRLSKNTGYAKANNIGVKIASELGHALFWILNPDTMIEADTLAHLRAFANETPKAQLISPVVLNNRSQRKVWSAGGFVSFEGGVSTKHMYSGMDENIVPQTPYSVDYVSGASIFCRKSIFEEVGFIPEKYFLYYEETDWCINIKKQMGDVIYVCPAAKMYHLKTSEANGLPSKYYFYYYLRNSINFTRAFSPEELDKSIKRLDTDFVTPWLDKIKLRKREELLTYKQIAQTALEDGRAKVFGRKYVFTEPMPEANFETSPIIVEATPKTCSFVLASNKGVGVPSVISLLIDGEIVLESKVQKSTILGIEIRSSITIPSNIDFSKPRLIQIAQADGQISEGLFVLNEEQAVYKGRIDGIGSYCINGWAINMPEFDEAVEVGVYCNGEKVATGLANLERSDLIRERVGKGKHAFSINLPLRVFDGKTNLLSIRSVATGKELHQKKIVCKGPLPPLPELSTLDQEKWLFENRQARFDENSKLIQNYFGNHREWQEHFGEQPKISVIMPVFNREDTVIESIQSVFDQSYSNVELILIDDGSTDNSIDVINTTIKGISSDKVRLIELCSNVGVSKARNAGLEAAEGDIIAYLDSDNVWDEKYLETMCSSMVALDKSTVYCAQLIFQSYSLNKERIEEPVAIRGGRFSVGQISNRNYIDLNCFMHSRELFDTLGGFNVEMTRLVDWELILRYTKYSRPAYIPSLLSNYYMDRADNQITRVQNYGSNLDLMLQSRMRSEKFNHSPAESPCVHLVIVADGQRKKLKATLDRHQLSSTVEKISYIIINADDSVYADLAEKPSLTKQFFKADTADDIISALRDVASDADYKGRKVAISDDTITTTSEAWREMSYILTDNKLLEIANPTIYFSRAIKNSPYKFAQGQFPVARNAQPFSAIFVNPNKHIYFDNRINGECFMAAPKTLLFLTDNLNPGHSWSDICRALEAKIMIYDGKILTHEGISVFVSN